MLFSLRKLALASAIFLPFINAQTVTVTERRNVCNAPGYRGPSSLASPAAYPSAAANNSVIADGTSFVIRIGQNVNGAPTYIAADGMTTSNKADAILFDIIDGQLASTGGFMSTGPVITDQLFTISRDSGAITGKFSMVDGALVWQNSAFGLGTAQFYIQPATTAGGPDYVYIRFTGLPTPGQYRVTLYPDTGKQSCFHLITHLTIVRPGGGNGINVWRLVELSALTMTVAFTLSRLAWTLQHDLQWPRISRAVQFSTYCPAVRGSVRIQRPTASVKYTRKLYFFDILQHD